MPPLYNLILRYKNATVMDSKIIISESICRDEVVDYIASRYSITPAEVINHFMCQDGIMENEPTDGTTQISFEENEMAILRDMGIRPSSLEFV